MKVETLLSLLQDPKYTRKKVRLSDGRYLSFSQCGNIESGINVLFCFGLMTSSIAVMFAHHVALQHNIRLIAVDYPGIGESTFQEDRSLDGWGYDMSEFCNRVLGRRAAVRLLGHSLGGLHVLALLSNRDFKKRVRRTVLVCPWVQFDGDGMNPPWMQFAHKLPDVFQSSIIPRVLTNLSSGTINLMGWSNPSQQHLQAAKLVTSYATLQGQAGNEQMVRFALSKSYTYLPQEVAHTLVVYHGAQDKLVLETTVSKLVRLLKERRCPTKYILVPDGDHNSVLARADNLSRILRTLGNKPKPILPTKVQSKQRTPAKPEKRRSTKVSSTKTSRKKENSSTKRSSTKRVEKSPTSSRKPSSYRESSSSKRPKSRERDAHFHARDRLFTL